MKNSGDSPLFCTILTTSAGPTPTTHPTANIPPKGQKFFANAATPKNSFADYCNTPRQTPLEHTLFACDELAGFITACCYVRPSKSVVDLEMESVKKKLKDKAFAKGVSRDDVRNGTAELGIPLEEHIAFCIAAMRENADALGLRGNLPVSSDV